jgi:hypothetical protein
MIVPIPHEEMFHATCELPSDPHAAHLTPPSKHLYLVQEIPKPGYYSPDHLSANPRNAPALATNLPLDIQYSSLVLVS